MNLNKLKYLRNGDVMGGAKCTARTARPRTPLPYTTEVVIYRPLDPDFCGGGVYHQCEKWPQGPFLRPCCPIGRDTPHQEDSRESGHKTAEKALGATFCIGPKGLFYGLVARFSRILLVGRLGGKYPSQSPIGTQGHRKVP